MKTKRTNATLVIISLSLLCIASCGEKNAPKKIKKDGTFAKIYEKNYANVENFDYVDIKKFHIRLNTRLPKYLGIIQEAAEEHGFDWRIVAAVIYQESHFNPTAKSYTGVEGLMQLTNNTAEEMGVMDRRDPEQSIRGGVRYIEKLYKMFDEISDPDRLLITLASYNVGRGHILDAQEIAEEMNYNPNRWSSLKEILPLLRHPKYHKKTRYGYCRGTEPVRYVNRILTYYDILKKEAVNKDEFNSEALQ